MQASYSISPDAICQEVAGETVILDLSGSFYYGLDPVGTRIWQLLGTGARLQEIIATLLDEYEVEEARLRQDVIDLINALEEAGLVQPRSP